MHTHKGVAMSAQDELRISQQPVAGPEPRFGRLTPWLITAALIIVSVLSWWALADPAWSPVGATQSAVNAVLFWTILAFIFTGFTFGNWPFNKLRQPLAGLLQVAASVAI